MEKLIPRSADTIWSACFSVTVLLQRAVGMNSERTASRNWLLEWNFAHNAIVAVADALFGKVRRDLFTISAFSASACRDDAESLPAVLVVHAPANVTLDARKRFRWTTTAL